MKGLFIKDLRLMKNQRNFLVTIVLMFLILVITGVDASFFMGYVPFLLLIVSMTTITYDELENGLAFLMVLPVSRKEYVLEKYLLGGLFGIGGLAVTVVIFIITEENAKTSMTWESYLLIATGFLAFVILFLSLMIPIQLKFGSEKGRLVLFAIFFGIIGLVYLVLFAIFFGIIGLVYVADKVIKVNVTATALYQNLLQLPLEILLTATFVLFAVFVLISIKISLGIMKKKEW